MAKKRQKKQDNAVEGKALNYSAYIGIKYTRQLNKLINQMTSQTEIEITKLFNKDFAKEYFEESTGQDASISSQSRILMNELTAKFEKAFDKRSRVLAEQMLKAVTKSSEVQLKSSLKEISGGLELSGKKATANVKEVLKASIAENAELIKTIPTRYMGQIQGEVMRAITTGNGMQNLEPFFAKQKGISKRHAKNMALDQTRKAYSSLNKARMQDVGIKKFKWRHSGGGQKPRADHLANYPTGLNGGIFSFDDLPVIDPRTGERGIPGQAINCKCVMIPVIEFEED